MRRDLFSRRPLPPTAAAASFTPTDLSGLRAWYDFNDIATLFTDNGGLTPVTSDGDPIGYVTNKGLDTVELNQGSTAKKPTYKTGIIGTANAARFDGGDGLQTESQLDLSVSGLSVFVIFRADSGHDGVLAELSDTYISNAGSFLVYRNSSDKTYSGIGGGPPYADFLSTGSVTTTPAVLSTVFDKTLSASEAVNWIDGASAGSRPNDGNTTGTFSASERLNVGARADGVSLKLSGDIGEIIIYNTALSTSDRQTVEAYLKSKWGTP